MEIETQRWPETLRATGRDQPAFYKVATTENEKQPACRLASLCWLGWQRSQPSAALSPVGMDLVWIFNYPTLISKLVFDAKTNNNNRQ